jgi:hypothetical protein
VPADHRFEPLLGGFTAPGREEMLAQIACTPAGHDLGGLALLRRDGEAWRVVRYWSRFDYRTRRDGCRALRLAGGRDLAVCRAGYAMWGALGDAVVVIDYAIADEEQSSKTLVSVLDNRGMACGGELKEVVYGGIDAIELVDLDRDGTLDVRVTLHAGKARIPKQPPCEDVGAATGGEFQGKVPPARKYTLEFLSKGERLVATPASAKAVAAIEAMKPKDP